MHNRWFFIPIVFFIFVVIGFGSCVSQKYTKKGIKYEQMGLKTDAAEYYYQALVRKTDNVEARLGLRRTGQILLDEKLQRFNEAYSQGNNSQAVEYYQKAQKYYDDLSLLNIDLNFPVQYQQYYEEAKNIFLEEQYLQAIQYLDQSDFSAAEPILRNILSLNANYRDVKEKLNIAVCEPRYRRIAQLMGNGKYRTAYSEIVALQKISFTYKDISDLKEECLEKGSVAIIIPDFSVNTNQKAVAQSLRLNVMRALQNLNNPFLILLENENSTTTARQMVLLNSSIKSLLYDAGKLSKTETKGWLKKVIVNQETGERKTSYSKIYYYVYQHKRSLNLDFNYQMTDQRTGEILKSNAENFSAADAVHYATYDGSSNDVVAGYWKNKLNIFNSKEDRVDDNYASNAQLRKLFNANKKIKDYNTLLNEVEQQTVEMIIYDIQKFLSNE